MNKIAAAVVMTCAVFIPGSASASGSVAYARYFSSNCTSGLFGAAYASFLPGSSDLVGARDGCKDGHSAVTRYRIGSSSAIHTLWAHGGLGNAVSVRISAAAGTTIQVQACTGEFKSRSILGCTKWGVSGSVGKAA
jgi:hypothetical protein